MALVVGDDDESVGEEDDLSDDYGAETRVMMKVVDEAEESEAEEDESDSDSGSSSDEEERWCGGVDADEENESETDSEDDEDEQADGAEECSEEDEAEEEEEEEQIGIFRIDTGEQVATHDSDDCPISIFADLGNVDFGLVAGSTANNPNVVLYYMHDGTTLREINMHPSRAPVEALCVLTDVCLVVLQADGTLSLWDVHSGDLFWASGFGAATSPLVSLGSHQLLVGALDANEDQDETEPSTETDNPQHLGVWDLIYADHSAGGHPAGPCLLKSQQIEVNCMDFADAGQGELAICTTSLVSVVSLATGQVLRSREASKTLNCIAASAEVRVFAVGDSFGAEVWDTETLELRYLCSMGELTFGVRVVVMEPGEEGGRRCVWLVASDQRGTCRWWELPV